MRSSSRSTASFFHRFLPTSAVLSMGVSKRRPIAPFRSSIPLKRLSASSSGRIADVPHLSILPRTVQVAEEDSVISKEPAAGATNEDVSDAIGDDDGESDSTVSTDSADTEHVRPEKSFDELDYQNHPLSISEKTKLYFEDETWVQHHNMCMISFLNLYIFADKYSVHQLRDDVMTAMIGQIHNWEWYPDPTFSFVSKAYSNLPTSAKLHQLLVDITAVIWLGDVEADLAIRVRDIHEWQSQSAYEVSLTQTKVLQAVGRGDIDDMGEYADKAFENSCSRHEHVLRDEDACRASIRKKAHVFATLIEACAKDAISMVKEQEKEDNSPGPSDQTEQSNRQ